MTRGPAKQFDPDVALDKAMQLFWSNGYAGTGLTELQQVMGIGRKSLYDTFGNKRSLFLKALDRYSKTIVRDLTGKLNDPDHAPLENVRAVMQAYAAECAQPMSQGCFLGVAMSQIRTDDNELAKVLRDHLLRVERAYHDAFAHAQERGELGADVNVRNLARLFVSAHQGLALIGRVSETPDLPDGIVEGALAALTSR